MRRYYPGMDYGEYGSRQIKIRTGKKMSSRYRPDSNFDRRKQMTKKAKTTKATKATKPAQRKAKAAQPMIVNDKTDKWGFKLGTKVAEAAKLYASKAGATREEVVAALGAPQMNMLTRAADTGYKVTKSKRKCRVTGKEVTAYHLAA
jgi:hypothetical protein